MSNQPSPEEAASPGHVLKFEPPLPEKIATFQAGLRAFALQAMRPVGTALDHMNPADAIAEDSPFWAFRKQYLGLGINLETLAGLAAEERALFLSIAFEELGYGDAGLAVSMGAGFFPQYLAAKFQNAFLLERFPETLLGCWAVTEPDHGSDMMDVSQQTFRPGSDYGQPNCVATIAGDRIVLNGRKSAWASNGTIADICLLYCAADTGSGPDASRGVVVVVPLDTDGVTRGEPLDKMGQRALNQGSILFDNVALSTNYILAGPEHYEMALHAVLCEANSLMAATFTGVAQSAYDLAFDYAHARRQGGAPIIRHQSVASRLFHMFRQTEVSRALTRRAILYNSTTPEPALAVAIAAKVTATQTAFDVASEAVQIYGANGLSKAHPVEKIMRDARASMIEDGCNEVLAIKGGYSLMDEERL